MFSFFQEAINVCKHKTMSTKGVNNLDNKESEKNKLEQEETLKILQSKLLEILIVFDKVCKEENLKYCLFGGSLLGAVRHKGFIPWDDDADIAMPRKDFEILKKVIKKHLPDNMVLQTYDTDPACCSTMLHIRNMDISCQVGYISPSFINSNLNGACLDVFPLDSAKKEHSVKNGFRSLCKKYLQVMAIRADKHNRQNKTFKQKLANTLAKTLSRKQWCALRDNLISLNYSEKGEFFLNLGSHYSYKKQVFLKSKIFPAKPVEFERYMFNAPNDIDYVLQKFYGKDYMQPPEKNQRQTHFTNIEIRNGNER